MELVQLQSTNSRPLALTTKVTARLVNVKVLAAFPYVDEKRSMDLNRRQILLAFYRYLLSTIINAGPILESTRMPAIFQKKGKKMLKKGKKGQSI